MRRTINDPDCCMWVVRMNGLTLVWGQSLVAADDETGEVELARRQGTDGPVTPYEDSGWFIKQRGDWFDGMQIVVEKRTGAVTFEPVQQADQELRDEWAYWCGRIDRSCGRPHWGRQHYPYRYDEQDNYDQGYDEGELS